MSLQRRSPVIEVFYNSSSHCDPTGTDNAVTNGVTGPWPCCVPCALLINAPLMKPLQLLSLLCTQRDQTSSCNTFFSYFCALRSCSVAHDSMITWSLQLGHLATSLPLSSYVELQQTNLQLIQLWHCMDHFFSSSDCLDQRIWKMYREYSKKKL